MEEAINLWKLENSSKEEMSEPATPPLLCREAAQGVSSGASPILGNNTDVPSTSAAGSRAEGWGGQLLESRSKSNTLLALLKWQLLDYCSPPKFKWRAVLGTWSVSQVMVSAAATLLSDKLRTQRSVG